MQCHTAGSSRLHHSAGAVLGATDSRKFEGICDDIFRFTPLDNQGLGYTVHGVNEAMPIESLEEGVGFFVAMIQQMC